MENIQNCSTTASTSVLATLPTEILVRIFDNLPFNDLCKVRAVNYRFSNIVDLSPELKPKFEVENADRFVVTGDETSDAFKFEGVFYRTGTYKTFMFTAKDVEEKRDFPFIFRQMRIRRITVEKLKNSTFSDDFVDYVMQQIRHSCDFAPLALTIRECDMGKISAEGLTGMLRECGEQLVHFTLSDTYNLRHTALVDERNGLFAGMKLTSLVIKNNCMTHPKELLAIHDDVFGTVSGTKHFPNLQVHNCTVSSMGLMQYFNSWVKAHGTNVVSNTICTFKDCPYISQSDFSDLCRKLPVSFSSFVEEEDYISVSHNGLNTFTINFNGEHCSMRNMADSVAVGKHVDEKGEAKNFKEPLATN